MIHAIDIQPGDQRLDVDGTILFTVTEVTWVMNRRGGVHSTVAAVQRPDGTTDTVAWNIHYPTGLRRP